MDVDKDNLDITKAYSGPFNGVITDLATKDSCFTYTPNLNFIGTDSFYVSICDTNGACKELFILIDVSPKAPEKNPDTAVSNNGSIPILVLTNDSDPNGSLLTLNLVTNATGGNISISGDSLIYSPEIDYCGIDEFEYSACNIYGLCDTAKVTVNVAPIDSDGDRIPDFMETTTADTDNDGVLDYLSQDSDGDGIADSSEAPGDMSDKCNLLLADCDNDGIPDFQDANNCIKGVTPPEGFSPDGDNMNDAFVIKGLENYPNNTIEIFNRWGAKVFDAAPYKNDWGGHAKNGVSFGEKPLPEGTYYYVLILNPELDPVKGYVYIKR
jgi:gliding motility-associated-like protein